MDRASKGKVAKRKQSEMRKERKREIISRNQEREKHGTVGRIMSPLTDIHILIPKI